MNVSLRPSRLYLQLVKVVTEEPTTPAGQTPAGQTPAGQTPAGQTASSRRPVDSLKFLTYVNSSV